MSENGLRRDVGNAIRDGERKNRKKANAWNTSSEKAFYSGQMERKSRGKLEVGPAPCGPPRKDDGHKWVYVGVFERTNYKR